MPIEISQGMTVTTPEPVTGDRQRVLRDVLGRYATGVTIVTTVHDGQMAGLTVNSFSALSLEPPLVLWCLRRESASYRAFAAAGHFAVNVLAADQRDLAIRFAGRGERFQGTPVRPGRYGLPLLSGTVAVLVCRRERLIPAGDHAILVGAVLDHELRTGLALLFLDGEYHTGPASTRIAARARS
jgi:flavin reductase (DIM6/NTAB) family NADH-FMN oxidoreductase RutF